MLTDEAAHGQPMEATLRYEAAARGLVGFGLSSITQASAYERTVFLSLGKLCMRASSLSAQVGGGARMPRRAPLPVLEAVSVHLEGEGGGSEGEPPPDEPRAVHMRHVDEELYCLRIQAEESWLQRTSGAASSFSHTLSALLAQAAAWTPAEPFDAVELLKLALDLLRMTRWRFGASLHAVETPVQHLRNILATALNLQRTEWQRLAAARPSLNDAQIAAALGLDPMRAQPTLALGLDPMRAQPALALYELLCHEAILRADAESCGEVHLGVHLGRDPNLLDHLADELNGSQREAMRAVLLYAQHMADECAAEMYAKKEGAKFTLAVLNDDSAVAFALIRRAASGAVTVATISHAMPTGQDVVPMQKGIAPLEASDGERHQESIDDGRQ